MTEHKHLNLKNWEKLEMSKKFQLLTQTLSFNLVNISDNFSNRMVKLLAMNDVYRHKCLPYFFYIPDESIYV